MHEAARFKANPVQVEAPERAEAVVNKAIALASEDGLSAKVAEVTYQAMVCGFIDYEQGVFAAAAARNSKPSICSALTIRWTVEGEADALRDLSENAERIFGLS